MFQLCRRSTTTPIRLQAKGSPTRASPMHSDDFNFAVSSLLDQDVDECVQVVDAHGVAAGDIGSVAVVVGTVAVEQDVDDQVHVVHVNAAVAVHVAEQRVGVAGVELAVARNGEVVDEQRRDGGAGRTCEAETHRILERGAPCEGDLCTGRHRLCAHIHPRGALVGGILELQLGSAQRGVVSIYAHLEDVPFNIGAHGDGGWHAHHALVAAAKMRLVVYLGLVEVPLGKVSCHVGGHVVGHGGHGLEVFNVVAAQ